MTAGAEQSTLNASGSLRRAGAVVAIEALAYAIVLPHLPLVAGAGVPWWAVGLLFAGYSAVQYLAIGPIGRLAERYGVRIVTVGCLAGTAIGLLLTAASTNYWVLLAGRLIDGVSAGTVVVVTAAALSVMPAERWTAALGRLSGARGTAGLVGIIATASIGVALAEPERAIRVMALGGVLLIAVAIPLTRCLPKTPLRPLVEPAAGWTASSRRRLGSHIGAQGAQAGLVVLAPAAGATVVSVRTGLAAPAAAIVGLAIGQVVLAAIAEQRRSVRAALALLLMCGLIAIVVPATLLIGFMVSGVAIGALVPSAQAALIVRRVEEGSTDIGANVTAGRGAIAGQIVAPAVAYAALSASIGVAVATIGLAALIGFGLGRPSVVVES